MLVDRRSSRTRGSSASLFVAQALLLVAAAARIVAKQPAADPDDDAVERLTADLKDNLKAQLRAREFNSAAIAHQLQQSWLPPKLVETSRGYPAMDGDIRSHLRGGIGEVALAASDPLLLLLVIYEDLNPSCECACS